MTNHKILFIALAVILTASSCDKDDVDVIPPSMDVNSYIPEPIADEICGAQEPTVFRLTGGDELTFDVVFNDDDALSQYKIDIHNNFDCHGHGGGSAPSVATPSVNGLTTDWTILDIQNISGTSFPVVRTLNVPENVTAGNYHFHLQVVDESGNDSPFANFFSLKITNPTDSVAPVLAVDEPAIRMFSVEKGVSIRFSGQVTDNHSLSEGGNGILYLAYTDLSSGNTFTTDAFSVFDSDVDQSFVFDFEFIIPNTWTTGSYRLSLGANDGVRNVAEFEFFEVEVTN